MSQHPAHLERLTDLLCDRLTLGLAPSEAAELQQLLDAHPEFDVASFERAAAAVAIAGAPAERLPEALAKSIESRAAAHLPAPRSRGAGAPIPFPRAAQNQPRSGSGFAWLAAAAAIGIAAIGWWPRLFPTTTAPVVAVELTPQQELEELLKSDPGVIRTAWKLPDETKPDEACKSGCRGEVIWSNERQQGYMRFTGLAANDPTKNQYQLWIFDKNQSAETPIDGGVFDIEVSSTGEAIIPIDAKLKVVEPFMFAVTIEKPGGVVRSERGRIPVLAKVGEG